MATDADSAREEAAVAERGDGGAGLVFWILIALAVATLAPCLVLPAWREYQQADLTAQIRTRQAELADAEVARLERRLDAIHNDPAVVARLARRELAYRGPGEELVAVPVDCTVDAPLPPALNLDEFVPVQPPVGITRLLAYLPDWDYDALFCTSPTRETLMGMSAGLIAAAFIIFWPRYRTRPES